MKSTPKSNIGFTPSWMQGEENVNTQQLEPITNILVSDKQEIQYITPAHLEVKERIEMTERAISQDAFATFEANKKAILLAELKWLVALDVQLGM